MSLALAQPALRLAQLTERREIASGTVLLELAIGPLAAECRAGQFVMVTPPTGQLAATALGVYAVRDDRISVMVVVCGPRTLELSQQREGARLTVLGPLGNGFDVNALGDDAALVAGGVGIASLLLLARDIRAAGRRAHLYYGARNAAALVDTGDFAALGAGVSLATDDGSRGARGYVTDLLAREGRAHTGIAACGPSPMLRATARVAEQHDVKAQLSLEETFACGVGACWGCVVGVDRASAQAPAFPPPGPGESRDFVHARICKEGPVFWAHELRW